MKKSISKVRLASIAQPSREILRTNVNLMLLPNFDLVKDRVENWLLTDRNLTNKNKSFKLKIGDVITFLGGYNQDIAFTSRIFAFDAQTGHAFVYRDCFWMPIDLGTKLLKAKDHIEITPKILKLNEKSNRISDVKNKIIETIQEMNTHKTAVFGYRSSCGKSDTTMKVYRIWLQALKEVENQGIYPKSENLIIGNSYATLSGGFWNEVKYVF